MDPKVELTGEVREVHRDRRTAIFDWRIPDVSQLPLGLKYSPTVTYFNIDWYLEIGTNMNGIDAVSLYGRLSTPGIHFTITCRISDGEERDVARGQRFPRNRHWWDRRINPPWRIPPSAGLTVTCSLRKGDPPNAPGVSRERRTEGATCSNVTRDDHVNPGVRATSSLSDHFKKLLLSGTGHDVLIKVGDKRFRAHRHILEARSPVFAAMFGIDMAESAEGSVTIEDCDPDAFGEFLQFVYSGKADFASVGRALGLYYAGDKYDFPSLKEMCVEFLENSFTTTTVFDVILLAARHGEEELLRRAIAFLSSHLEEVMRTVEWQSFMTANPIQANEMCLKALECKKR